MLSRAWLNSKLVASSITLEKYGNGAEAWYVPADIAPGSIAYCGGVGLDANYDFALAEVKHCKVFSFDPTPLAIAYMERENRGRVEFHPWGLLDSDQIISFYAPYDVRHGSWFAENLHNTSRKVDAQCHSLKSIMTMLGHDHIDLLKIDIEGSWHAVLLQMVRDGIFPQTICVEFDSPAPIGRVRAVTNALLASGYDLILREHDNAVFSRTIAKAA
jgi:FkbM family methyltransferase